MKMEISEHGSITVVKPYDRRMDAPSVVGFKATMHEISESGASHFVLDMSVIEFMDSSGLGALVSVLKMMSPDKKFELAGPTEPVRKVFKLTRMDQVFTIYPRIEDALNGHQRMAG